MPQGLETEIKLVASPAMLQQLRVHPLLAGAEQRLELVSTYFDTACATLHRHRASLRVRDGGTAREQTLKLPLASASAAGRGEWSVQTLAEHPDPTLFPEEPAAILRDLVGDAPLKPLIRTRISRTVRTIAYRGATIEAAFDTGTIGARPPGAEPLSEAVCELELELVDGEIGGLFALALELPLGPELSWSLVSKSERGRALAFAQPAQAVSARAVGVRPGMTREQGFVAVARNCLEQVLGNYRLVLATGDPGALHQLRVGIRRLRALFSLFGKRLHGPRTTAFRAAWKEAGNALGPARDAHVLLEEVRKADGARGEEACGELIRVLEQQRAQATASARQYLARADFQRLLIGFARWLETDELQEELARANAPLDKFARKVLSRRRKSLGKAQSRLPRMEAGEIHNLRIAVKKLRYGAEFFAGLYPHGKAQAETFARMVRRLQDELGKVHDMDVASDAREARFAGMDRASAGRLEATLAGLMGDSCENRARALRRAEQYLARALDLPRWWRGRSDGRDAT